MRLKHVRIAAIGVLLGVTAGAVTSAQEAEKKGWERSISLGLSVTTGNSDTVLFVGAIEAQRAWEKDELRFLVEGAYGKNDGDKSVERGRALGQYKHLFDERMYGTLLSDIYHDGIATLAYRVTVSPGIGYYFIKTPKTQLTGEVGPSFIHEKYNGESADNYFGLRLAERFDRKLSDTARLWQALEVTPQIDDFDNYVALLEVGVEASLTKTLSVRVVGQDRYDSQPAEGRKHNDISLVSSLNYKF